MIKKKHCIFAAAYSGNKFPKILKKKLPDGALYKKVRLLCFLQDNFSDCVGGWFFKTANCLLSTIY